MPYFLSVNNTEIRDKRIVAKGHERVLRARLEDAQFFFNNDKNNSFDSQTEKLKKVLFQADLGSVYDKVERIGKISGFLAMQLNLENTLIENLKRAASISKTDLVSQVVIEFPKLQGIMGRVYALDNGERKNVAAAVEEHYRPLHAGGRLPETTEGSLLSIADKIDSICGCFSLGLIPTGASDPYALRRQAIGILQIALKKEFSFSFNQMIQHSLMQYEKNQSQKVDDIRKKVFDFLKGRMAYLLEADGVDKDAVAAILSVDCDQVPNTWQRAVALQKLKNQPDFKTLATNFKRVVNIIKKADSTDIEGQSVNSDLFDHDSERVLFDTFNRTDQNVKEFIAKGYVEQAFDELALMRNAVDSFFDDVMVMTENRLLRKNRLALLGGIANMFALLADFSKIST